MRFYRQPALFDYNPYKRKLPVTTVMFATQDGPVFRDIPETDRKPQMPALKGTTHLAYDNHYAVVYLTNGDAVIVMNDRVTLQKDYGGGEFSTPYPGQEKEK